MLLSCLTFVLLWSVSEGYAPFRLIDCSVSPNRVLTINGGLVEHPVTIPGHVRAPSTVTIHRPISQGDLRLDVTVDKFIVFDYFTLPCVSKVGSCSYDVCELLGWYSSGCPWQLADSNFPCTCPFEPATHTLEPHPFYIPAVRGVWQWIAYGDFRVNGRLVNKTSGEELNCYTVEFTVQPEQQYSYWDYWGW